MIESENKSDVRIYEVEFDESVSTKSANKFKMIECRCVMAVGAVHARNHDDEERQRRRDDESVVQWRARLGIGMTTSG